MYTKFLQQNWLVDTGSKQVFMQLTHLAMALGRIKRGCQVSPLNANFIDEIQSSVYFPQVSLMLQQLLRLIPFPIPNSEQTHFIANLYSLALAQPQILQYTSLK